MKLDLFKGRPDFPVNEPEVVAAAGSTNATDQIMVIDTGGQDATFNAGMKKVDYDGNETDSGLIGETVNGVIYGRWTNVSADVQLLCYPVIVANSEE